MPSYIVSCAISIRKQWNKLCWTIFILKKSYSQKTSGMGQWRITISTTWAHCSHTAGELGQSWGLCTGLLHQLTHPSGATALIIHSCFFWGGFSWSFMLIYACIPVVTQMPLSIISFGILARLFRHFSLVWIGVSPMALKIYIFKNLDCDIEKIVWRL